MEKLSQNEVQEIQHTEEITAEKINLLPPKTNSIAAVSVELMANQAKASAEIAKEQQNFIE